jgi:hypothetical protein
MGNGALAKGQATAPILDSTVAGRASLNLASLELCVLGLVLALAVPAVSWLKQSVLFIILAAFLAVGVGMAFWSSRKVN